MYELIKWAARHRQGFFLREKSNYEWECGWKTDDSEFSVRADNALAAMQALQFAGLGPANCTHTGVNHGA